MLRNDNKDIVQPSIIQQRETPISIKNNTFYLALGNKNAFDKSIAQDPTSTDGINCIENDYKSLLINFHNVIIIDLNLLLYNIPL